MNIGIVFAGGIGKRMRNSGTPKQFLKIEGKEIIIRTIEIFEKCSEIDGIIIACLEEKIDDLKKLIKKYDLKKVLSIVPGGETGQQSIYNALKETKIIVKKEEVIVLIHDGVRPLISSELLRENILMVKKNGNCITTAEAIETILVKDSKDTKVLNRDICLLARAPQSFYLDEILKVHLEAKRDKKEYIDSASMMKSYGYDLNLLKGPQDNIKITTPADYFILKGIYEMKKNSDVFGVEE